MRNDGPQTLPERLKKADGVVTLSKGSVAHGWSASLMAYDAQWTSTDQVRQRAIDAGQIGRFDAIDPSDGGKTSRSASRASGATTGREAASSSRAT